DCVQLSGPPQRQRRGPGSGRLLPSRWTASSPAGSAKGADCRKDIFDSPEEKAADSRLSTPARKGPGLSAALHVESQETAAGGQSQPRQATESVPPPPPLLGVGIPALGPEFCGLTRKDRNAFGPGTAAPDWASLRALVG